MKSQIDYSLYLVTDSTEAILGSRDLLDVVEQALPGGLLSVPPLHILCLSLEENIFTSISYSVFNFS